MNPELKRFMKQQSEYVYNPAKWAWDMVRFDADKWQREALTDLVTKKFLLWTTGVGVGKSATLSIATLWFLSTRPFPRVPSTAPTEHQLKDILWAEHAKWLRRSELLSRMFKWTAERVALRGHEEEWYAVARTARPKPGEQSAEGLQGFHSGHILFLVDEASAVDDSIFNAMDGAFTTPDAYAILATNPTRRSGYVFRILTDDAFGESWAVRRVDANTARMVEPASIQRIIKIYGKDSDYYRMKVLGILPAVDFSSLISDEQMAAAHERDFVSADGDGSVIMSCDPARFGSDYTVFFVRRGRKVIDRRAVHGMDTTEVTKIGLDLFDLYHPDHYLIDVIGIGSGVVDQTKKILRDREPSSPKDRVLTKEEGRNRGLASRILEINVGEAAVDSEKHSNKRAEMFWHLREIIDSISIPIETKLLDEELPKIHYGYTKNAKIDIEAKKELRKSLGRSPNDADALGLLFYSDIVSGAISVSADTFKIGVRTGADMTPVGAEMMLEEELGQWTPAPQGTRMPIVGARKYGELFTTPTGSRWR